MKRLLERSWAALPMALLSGCSRSPNVDILGSYFPGWIICVVLGVGLTGIAHVVLRQRALLNAVGHPALIYPCLVLLFSCVLWLCLFA